MAAQRIFGFGWKREVVRVFRVWEKREGVFRIVCVGRGVVRRFVRRWRVVRVWL